MSPVDIAIVVILLVSIIIGIFRGLIREVLSLASWIIAFLVARFFTVQGATYLEPYVSQEVIRQIAAFTAIFICVLIVLSIISYVIYRLFALAGITGLDRSLGAVFGVIRGVAVVSLLILAATFMDMTPHAWFQTSKLAIYFAPVNEFIISLMPAGAAENFITRAPDYVLSQKVT